LDIDFLFSDRFKRVGLATSLVVLAWLGLRYASFATNVDSGYRWCVEQPEECDGERLLLPLWDVVEVSGDGYALYKTAGPVPVFGDPSGIAVGDTISLEGTFRASDLTVIEVSRQVHHLRKYKKGLSALGLIVVFLLMIRDWKLEGLEVTSRG
tara:strand:- start:265 stop:723 length:459 start_codon:yes stop_codon:yes gene_type:complete